MITRKEAESFRNQAFLLACQIGIKPAADALGIKDSRIRQWNKRYWQGKATAIFGRNTGRNNDLAATSRNVTSPIDAMANVMTLMADRTKLAMARTAMRAFEHSDELTEDQLHEMDRAIALEKHGRNASVAHSWNSNMQTVAVQVNVPMPSKEERDEMRSMDAKLDAIAARLRDA